MLKLSSKIIFLFSALWLLSCAQEARFVAQGKTDFYVQDYNPPRLEILWVMDTRSPMKPIQNRLVNEATQLFLRLEQSTYFYQMGFITTGVLSHEAGKLQPLSSPAVITPGLGNLNQRVQHFKSVLPSSFINLNTDGSSKGFEAARALLSNGTDAFKTDSRIPLVLIFISDSDEHSSVTLSQFESYLLSLKGNQRDLVRIYSVNLTAGGSRCTSQTPDIDNSNYNFQDKYFSIANLFPGDTADLCQDGFSNNIDLSGLRTNDLNKRFPLSTIPIVSTIRVSLTLNGNSFNQDFSYDPALNEIVFQDAPPEGAIVEIKYEAE